MDRDVWIVLGCALRIVCRELPRPARRFEYSDRLIILMWLWAVLHDRSLSWACRRENYSSLFRPRTLPGVSQFCKRLATERFVLVRRLLHEILSAKGHADLLHILDGKALTINDGDFVVYVGEEEAKEKGNSSAAEAAPVGPPGVRA